MSWVLFGVRVIFDSKFGDDGVKAEYYCDSDEISGDEMRILRRWSECKTNIFEEFTDNDTLELDPETDKYFRKKRSCSLPYEEKMKHAKLMYRFSFDPQILSESDVKGLTILFNPWINEVIRLGHPVITITAC